MEIKSVAHRAMAQPSPIQPPEFKLEYKGSYWPGGDASRYLEEASGSIMLDDDTGTPPVEAGRFAVTYVNIRRALNMRQGLADIFDTSDKLYEVGAIMFGDEPDDLEYTPAVHKASGAPLDATCSDLLILDRVEILPEFRGHGLGLAAMFAMIDHFSRDANFVVLKCFPLQFDYSHIPAHAHARSGWSAEDKAWFDRMEYSKMPQDQAQASARLAKLYRSAGFTPIAGGPFMLIDLTLQKYWDAAIKREDE